MDPLEPLSEDIEVSAALGADDVRRKLAQANRAAEPVAAIAPDDRRHAPDSSGRPHWPAKVLGAAALGVLCGFGACAIALHRHQLGKQGFLDAQAQQWDARYADLKPVALFIAGALFLATVLAVYELLVALFGRLRR